MMTEELDREKALQRFNDINDMLNRWPEDRVKTILEQRLTDEGWSVDEVHFGTERGKDLVASRSGKRIIIEAKGEPSSPKSYQQQRRQYVGGAFVSAVSHMSEDAPDVAICVAFPQNGFYPGCVLHRIPTLVRGKLRLSALFVEEDSSVLVLHPNTTELSRLNSFSDLFALPS